MRVGQEDLEKEGDACLDSPRQLRDLLYYKANAQRRCTPRLDETADTEIDAWALGQEPRSGAWTWLSRGSAFWETRSFDTIS